MLKKCYFTLLLISASMCIGLMSNTYSRYVADTTGNIDILFAKWQILVNNTDITTNNSSSINFEPVIVKNTNVANDVMAPTSKGYFDIDIDPTNVDVSFTYTINLEIENENIPDLMITEYAIIPNNYSEGNDLEKITLNDFKIINDLDYDNTTKDFSFQPFTVRVYFEWYDGQNGTMTDSDDTNIGNLAAAEETSFKINANITFEQKISATTEIENTEITEGTEEENTGNTEVTENTEIIENNENTDITN